MHATVRNYSGTGSKELIDLLEKRKDEVKGLLTSIKGFVSYSLVRTPQGGFRVSVYQDKAGVDESMKRAKEWIGQNASATGAARQRFQRERSSCSALRPERIEHAKGGRRALPYLSPPRTGSGAVNSRR